jgi:hypothetical protein
MKSKIKAILSREGLTIPEICKRLDIENEYAAMRAVAQLEASGDAILSGFDRIYREDGGAIYLAKYGIPEIKALKR